VRDVGLADGKPDRRRNSGDGPDVSMSSRDRILAAMGVVAFVAVGALVLRPRGPVTSVPETTRPSSTTDASSAATPATSRPPTAGVPTTDVPAPDGAIVVDPAAGDDAGSGTAAAPFRTLERAQLAARGATRAATGEDVVVLLRGGVYELAGTFRLTPLDSGSDDHDVVYRAVAGERAVIEGGVELSGWETFGEVLYRVEVPERVDTFRQFYARGRRQARARTATAGATALRFEKEEILGRPRDAAVVVDGGMLAGITHPEDLELVYVGVRISGHGVTGADGVETERPSWRSHRLEVERATPAPDGAIRLDIAADALYHATDRGFWKTFVIPSDPFYLENAFELLDEPGEWFFDERDRLLYWWPPDGGNPDDVDTWIPAVETLLDVDGTPSEPVHDIRIEGLTFRHSTYTVTSREGYVPGQGAGLFMGWEHDDWMEAEGARSTYLDRPIPQGLAGAAVEMDSVHDLAFTGNVLTHLGSDGMLLHNDVVDVTISGNVFSDVSGGGLVAGHEVHEVIDEPMERLIERIELSDNLFEQTGREYFSSAGVQVYKSADFVIEHNEFRDMPWVGLSLGWGFANNPDSFVHVRNRVVANRFDDVVNTLYDGGAIYLLGPTGTPDAPLVDHTVVSDNVVEFSGIQPKLPGDLVDPDYAKRAGIQLDEGNRNVVIEDNLVFGSSVWLQVTEWPSHSPDPAWRAGLHLSGSGNWTDGAPSLPGDLARVGIARPGEVADTAARDTVARIVAGAGRR